MRIKELCSRHFSESFHFRQALVCFFWCVAIILQHRSVHIFGNVGSISRAKEAAPICHFGENGLMARGMATRRNCPNTRTDLRIAIKQTILNAYIKVIPHKRLRKKGSGCNA